MSAFEQHESELVLKAFDADKGIIEGYASIFGNVDDAGDVVTWGAYRKTIADHGGKFPVLWFHDPTSPIGMAEVWEDEVGLRFRAQLVMSVQKARDVFDLVKAGAARAVSVAIRKIVGGMTTVAGKRVQELKEVALREITLATTNFAVNGMATVTSFKAAVAEMPPVAEGDPAWDSVKARANLRNWASDASGNLDFAKYRQGFLWYNEDNYKALESYRIPVCDIVEGELRVIPRAVAAAADALRKAHGGGDIPPGDVARIERLLTRLTREVSDAPSDVAIKADADNHGAAPPEESTPPESVVCAIVTSFASPLLDTARQLAVESEARQERRRLQSLAEETISSFTRRN
jgi:HK97 family phage prohead protease